MMFFELRRTTTAFAIAFVSAAALVASACGENPQEPRQRLTADELSVTLAVEPDHVHILQTEATFQVAVRTPGGEAVTDFEALEVGRAHAEAGGYRVEFEAFPGHVHAEDTATLRFWVKEQEEDGSGSRPPIEGLSPESHVTEADGHGAEHPAEAEFQLPIAEAH